jgi:hypothetical protein
MPIVNLPLLCYKHQQFLQGKSLSNRGNCLGPGCNGYDHGSNSSFPCSGFASTTEVLKGVCIYELHSRDSLKILHDSNPDNCVACSSDHNSGKSCTFYTGAKDYFAGTCALKIRSARLLDKLGSMEELSKSELYCFEKCSANLDSDCEGYVPVDHVTDQICGHKSKLIVKLRKGLHLEGCLEENCNNCPGRCDKELNCVNGFVTISEKIHFEVLNRIYPTKVKDVHINAA